MKIELDDLSGPEIAQFLANHVSEMQSISPPQSSHALSLEALKKPEITFWTVWEDQKLVGCGALSELSPYHGEIKSMQTSPGSKRKGVASELLRHIFDESLKRGYHQLSLETGSMAFFLPARRLYEKFGFAYCKPFANYTEDPNSVFMTKEL